MPVKQTKRGGSRRRRFSKKNRKVGSSRRKYASKSFKKNTKRGGGFGDGIDPYVRHDNSDDDHRPETTEPKGGSAP